MGAPRVNLRASSLGRDSTPCVLRQGASPSQWDPTVRRVRLLALEFLVVFG